MSLTWLFLSTELYTALVYGGILDFTTVVMEESLSFETDKTQEQILKNLINLLCAFLVKYHKVIILFLIVLIRVYFKIYWLIAP